LGCLGIIRSVFSYSSKDDLARQISHRVEISYDLAHSIIVSAVKYAENLGFYPPEIFTQATSFFLEEDDKVSLTPVKCGGEDGKPLFIISLDDSSIDKTQVIAQLKKAVGEGNFHYTLKTKFNDFDDDDFDDDNFDNNDDDNDDDFDDFEFDDDEEEDDDDIFDKIFGDSDEEDDENEEDDDEPDELQLEIESLSKDEQVKMFLELIEKPDKDDVQKIQYLADALVDELVDEDDIGQENHYLFDDLCYPVTAIEEFPDTLFAGIKTDDPDAIIDLFFEVNNTIAAEKNAKKALKKFQKAVNPEAPLVAYLELFYLNMNNKAEYYKKLKKYSIQYPDYFLIQLSRYFELSTKVDASYDERNSAFGKLRILLSEYGYISDCEYSIFVRYYLIVYLSLVNDVDDKIQTLTKINAVYGFLDEDDILVEEIKNDIYLLLFGIKIDILSAMYSKK
jgi:hypothetical protein